QQSDALLDRPRSLGRDDEQRGAGQDQERRDGRPSAHRETTASDPRGHAASLQARDDGSFANARGNGGGDSVGANPVPGIWLAAGLRTPFARADGPLSARDALSLSVPLVQALARGVSGPIDFAVWGSVAGNLTYSNLAREIWLEAALDPHVPAFTTVLQCCTSMVAAFEAAGMLGRGEGALAMVGGSESMSRIQVGLSSGLSVGLRRLTQARTPAPPLPA